jgi:pyruvyl transferase EpsO
MGTESFFASHSYAVKERYSYHDFPKTLPSLQPSDVLFFHGGGNFGDLYPEHINLLLEILQRYPDHQVVAMPQTIYFKSKKNQDEVASRLAKHRRLHVFVRDQISFEALSQYGFADLALVPDMAHHLVDHLHPSGPPLKENLYLIRNDAEIGIVPGSISDHASEFVDWDDSLSFAERVKFAVIKRLVPLCYSLGLHYNVVPHWYRLRDSMVESGIQLISQGNKVTTNRLHGMLLSALLGKRVTAIDNSYGKLSSYFNTWLQDVDDLKFMETK